MYGNPSSSAPFCLSLTYAPDNADTASIIERTLAGTTLTLRDTRAFRNESALRLDWVQNVGQRDVAIVFSSPLTPDRGRPMVNQSRYSFNIWYNATQSGAQWRVLSLQFALEQAIANTIITAVEAAYPLTGHQSYNTSSGTFLSPPSSPSSSLQVSPSSLTPSSLSWSFFPQLASSSTTYTKTASTALNDQASQLTGAGLLTIATTLMVLLLVHAATQEKQLKMLAMMRMNGVFDSAWWCSWLIVYALISLVASLVATVVGVASGLQVYSQVAFSVHFISLWLFSARDDRLWPLLGLLG